MKTQLEIMTELVDKYHDGQFRRDGKPYKTHLQFVRDYVFDERYSIFNLKVTKFYFQPVVMEEIQAAALGHDLLEDTECTEEIMARAGVSGRVIGWVRQLTRRDDESYFDFIMRLKEPVPVAIKLSDLHHNMTDNSKEGSLLDKYRFTEYHLKQLVKNNYILTL